MRAERAWPSRWSHRPWALHRLDNWLTECFWKRVECTLAMHIKGFLPAALSSSIVFWKDAKLVLSSSEGAMNLQGVIQLKENNCKVLALPYCRRG